MRTSTKKVKTNSIQMTHNRQGNPSLSCVMTYYHGQFPYFHRRREEKAKLSPPWDPTNFEPKLLTKSTHSFLPGNLSGVTSSSKTLCNFFDLVAATPDAMVDTSSRSLAACHNTEAADS